MSPYLILIILCAVSGGLLALSYYSRWWSNLGSYILLFWLAASLPIMYFTALDRKLILLFYMISAAIGLAIQAGGAKK